ncbi:hypothetical protein [Streptomyces sp. NBC_01408]|uniref:hypothetical protein n=1 Tax=Streptomyces sp. NBC_01408 TaxID=2903855 RepID=UPI002255F684|nr:hypothetical protein [Streptomyces sp. NBC_01408]MCX4693691.1 hypothetical protein [Streptomyces sp. NBC_01408]
MTRRPSGAPLPEPRPESTAPLPPPELTEAECRRCGTYIAGLDGRYACGVCGWVNDHSEGHRRLPRADEDPDRPAKGRRRPKQLPGPLPEAPQAGAAGPGAGPGTGP